MLHCVTLPAGKSKTYTLTVKAIKVGNCTNTATVTFTNPQTNGTQTVNGTAPITVYHTCATYDKDGKSFNCSAGSSPNAENAGSKSPSQDTCCTVGGSCNDLNLWLICSALEWTA